MLVYRVFPYLPAVTDPTEPGHPRYVHRLQGVGRWDNPHLYLVRYLATSPEAAVGEAFAPLATWSPAMLNYPVLAGARRVLGTYRFDEKRHPLLDLDDASALVTRNLRPNDIVRRDRARTQQIAADIYAEDRWAGLSWWPFHRPQWTLMALWAVDNLSDVQIDDLDSHPAIGDAAVVLAKPRRGI
jgi:hypothetical protein